MARISLLYPTVAKYLADNTVNMASNAFKVALLTDAYNPVKDWTASETIAEGQYRKATSFNMHYYKCTTAGTTGVSEPVWVINGGTVTDGTVVWTDIGVTLTCDMSEDTVWADISTHELAAGNGYTAGGVSLINLAVTNGGWDADDAEFIALGTPSPVTFMWAVLYKNGTANGIVNPLICLYLFNDTPNITNDNYRTIEVNNSDDYTIKFSVSGITTFSLCGL